MNRYAYLLNGRLVPLMEGLSKLRVHVHNPECIPRGSVIFVVNRCTRLETLLVPYHIYRLIGRPVWSLADHSCFEGVSALLEKVGGVSALNPDRDLQMVKTLLAGEGSWITYFEGRPVQGRREAKTGFFRSPGSWSPHSEAAALGLRTEFYRQRLARLSRTAPEEAQRVRALFQIEDLAAVLGGRTSIVPVNLTYYPLSAREKILGLLAGLFLDDVSTRLGEEILSKGSTLFAGVDIDLRFGPPLDPADPLSNPLIQRDIRSPSPIGFDDRLPSLHPMRRAAERLTERLMAQIEALTTVNHDHLCASLLRALPFKKRSEEDFRRRVYLLASSSLEEKGVFCHRSLKREQVALLTDDRYHRCRDFFLLAAQKGVLTLRGDAIIRDRRKLSPAFEPRRGCLDNPVGGLAAEVLPLRLLQREVRKTAWLPGWLVRRKVAERLQRQALEDFEEDYRAFFRPGESKGGEVGAPALLRGRSREVGVVLVHGFLAAPMEVAELASHLHGEGHWVYLVRLKGHGTAPEDLALRSRNDWLESVDRGYALMRGICRQVVLGGFSFGGGVVLDCASRVRGVAGVFAVCPPHRLMDISSRFVPAVSAWNRVMDFLRLQGGKMEYAQIFPERPLINYHRLPICAVRQLEYFMRQLELRLKEITVPALVLQGDADPVVDQRGSRRLFQMLGSSDKEYRLLPRARHGILAGEGAEEVHAEIAAFVRRVTGGGGSPRFLRRFGEGVHILRQICYKGGVWLRWPR